MSYLDNPFRILSGKDVLVALELLHRFFDALQQMPISNTNGEPTHTQRPTANRIEVKRNWSMKLKFLGNSERVREGVRSDLSQAGSR